MLEDLAIVSAGQLISEELGIKLENVTLQMLGRAKYPNSWNPFSGVAAQPGTLLAITACWELPQVA